MSYSMLQPKPPTRIIYVFATAITFLFIIALVWFMLYAVILPIGASLTTVADTFHNSSWPLHTNLTQAETFMSYFWQLLLVFAVFGLAYWVWITSQRKGRIMQ